MIIILNGNFKLIGAYSELGEEDGNWATFDEQGKLIKYQVYEYGQLIDGKYYSIDSDGLWQYNDVYKYENFEADEAFWIDYNAIGDRKFPNQILMNDRLFIPVKKGELFQCEGTVVLAPAVYIRLLNLFSSGDGMR